MGTPEHDLALHLREEEARRRREGMEDEVMAERFMNLLEEGETGRQTIVDEPYKQWKNKTLSEMLGDFGYDEYADEMQRKMMLAAHENNEAALLASAKDYALWLNDQARGLI